MNIRCDKCGELIWFSEDDRKALLCDHCGKLVENPNRKQKKEKQDK